MNGGYDLEGVIWHQHSNKLMKKILELWTDKKTPIIDLGCGHNFYISVMIYADYHLALGYDVVDLGSLWCMVADVTQPIKDRHWQHKEPFVNILSLEVGEHIPYEKCFGYLDNLASFGGDVIMSWAVPGQAGHGHINCQTNEWVKSQMAERFYVLDIEKTDQLRESVNGCHCSWFSNTLMYFRPRSTFSMI